MSCNDPKRDINSYIDPNNNLNSFNSENSEHSKNFYVPEYPLKNEPNKLSNIPINEFGISFLNESNKQTYLSSINDGEYFDEDKSYDAFTKNNWLGLNDFQNDFQDFFGDIDNKNNNDINIPIPQNFVQEESQENTNYLRRKRKKNSSKFKDDSLRRKVRHILLDNILDFINHKISEPNEHKTNFGTLQNISQNERSDGNVENTKKFLNKTLFEIFSSKITGRIKKYLENYNENIIKNLLEEKDLDKRNYFNNLFKLTFVQSLNHFNGTEYYKELNGMKKMSDEVKKASQGDEEYEKNLKHYFLHFEEIINNKKSKKNKRKNCYKK